MTLRSHHQRPRHRFPLDRGLPAAAPLMIIALMLAGCASTSDRAESESSAEPGNAESEAGAPAPDAAAEAPAREAEAEAAAPEAEAPATDSSTEEVAFRAILSDEELREYGSLPQVRREDWRRRFWRAIDPDPTTAKNERLEEHGARIARARELFARGGVLEWDDRVSALVRFGEPLVRVEDGGEVRNRVGLDPPRERWLYRDLFLYMEDRNLDGLFQMGISSLASGIGRVDNLGEEDTFFKDQPKEPVSRVLDFEDRPEVEKHFPDFSVNKLAKMLEQGRKAWIDTPRIYVAEKTGREIPFVFDVSTFRAADRRTELVVSYLIPIEALATDARGVWAERRTVVIDQEQRVVGSDIAALEQPPPSGNARGRWILNTTTLAVSPGSYLLASRVTDLVSPSRDMGLIRTEAEAPDYGAARLAMSDLLFGSAIEEAGDEAAAGDYVVRRGWRIRPTPVRQFDRLAAPHLYFEVYNLAAGDSGRYKYKVDYTLTKQEPRGFLASITGIFKGKLTQGIATSFERETSGPDVDNWIAIDVAELPPDTYFIETRVTDLVSGAETSRRESFVVGGAAG